MVVREGRKGGVKCGEGGRRGRNAKINKCRVAKGSETKGRGGEESVASTEKEKIDGNGEQLG